MTRTLAALALCLTAAGCVYTVEQPDRNYAPEVIGPLAGCYWSPAHDSYIWWFDSFATDPNGPWDVQEAWADVYDGPTDRLIESFPLYRMADPERWYSDWLGWSTLLDCRYDGYIVDIVAYDHEGSWDLKSVYPSTD